MTIVSANGPGPEWDVESDVELTGPEPGPWLSDVPNVKGRACVITTINLCRLGLARVTTAQREGCDVTRIAIQ